MDPDGGSVAIWPMDPEKMEPSGPAEVYGDWDAAAYLRRVVELIHPNRQINIPDLEAMIRAAAKDGVDICTYCPDYNCRGCIVNEWKEDPDLSLIHISSHLATRKNRFLVVGAP